MSDSSAASHEKYRETLTAPSWMRAIGVVCLALAAGLIVLGVLFSRSIFSDASGIIGFVVGLMALVAVGALLLSTSIRILVTTDQLELSLRPLVRIRLRLAGLEKVNQTTVSPTDVGGAGYRIWGSTRAFLFDSGPALEVVDSASGRHFICRSNSVGALVAAVTAGGIHPRP